MSSGFHRLEDDHVVLVDEATSRPNSYFDGDDGTREGDGDGHNPSTGGTRPSGLRGPTVVPSSTCDSINDIWRPWLQGVFNHMHFDIGIIMFVILYVFMVLLEMIVNLDMLNIHHTSPVPHWLHLMSVSILAYFVVEVCLRVYAFGSSLLYARFELFDITLVLGVFLLELIFITHEDAYSSSGLLILLRLWRISNIINGLIKNVQNEKSRQIRTLQKEIESYRSTNLRLTRKNERLQRKVRFYEMEFESRGITLEYETFEDLQEDEMDLRQSAASPSSETSRGRNSPPMTRNLADEGLGSNQGDLASNAQAMVEGQLSFQT